MPRISMWRPNKTSDYFFIDRQIREQFHVGGTGCIIHKYVGPQEGDIQDDPTQPNYQDIGLINETSIQDLLFLENRDRKYEMDLYELRGVYNVSDNDFDLTQFGLFLTNDTLYMTFHLNEMIEVLGRKLLSGDVIELPHLLDNFALNADTPAIPKFYTVTDGNNGGEGFSATWWPHIWRCKLEPITNSQEFDDILGSVEDEDSMANVFSVFAKEFAITEAIAEEAANWDPTGEPRPLYEHLYNFVLMNDQGWNPGETIPAGDSFPSVARAGDWFIRSDFTPERLFSYDNGKWARRYDNIPQTQWQDNTFNGSTFVNTQEDDTTDGTTYVRRQAITQAILPRDDFDGETGLD